MRVLRRIKGVTRRLNKIRNVNLRDRLKQEGVLELAKEQQQRWKQKLRRLMTAW